MSNRPLKVWGEELVAPAAIAASMPGTGVLRLGKTMSGIELRVIVEGSDHDTPVVFPSGSTVTIQAQHSQDGEMFVDLPAWECDIVETEALPGTVLARMTLPTDCLPYVKASLEFSDSPAGKVSLAPGYLPR